MGEGGARNRARLCYHGDRRAGAGVKDTGAEAGTWRLVRGEGSPQHSGGGTGWRVRPKAEAGGVPKKHGIRHTQGGAPGGESMATRSSSCQHRPIGGPAASPESAAKVGGGRWGRPPSSEAAGLWPRPSGTHNPPHPAGSLVLGRGGQQRPRGPGGNRWPLNSQRRCSYTFLG